MISRAPASAARQAARLLCEDKVAVGSAGQTGFMTRILAVGEAMFRFTFRFR